jgi:ribose/xylose/arabinose/galactoside ABC-type transport system permease subunit
MGEDPMKYIRTPVAALDQNTAVQKLGGSRAGSFTVSREFGLLVLTFGAVILFSILYPRSFCNFANFAAVARNLAFDGILAVGMMLLMVSGVFDLSVGAMFSMAGVLTAWLLKEAHLPVPLAILCGLAAATLGGLINGFIVARVRVNALITTLGTMQIFRGIAVLVGGPGINFLPESFSRLGQAQFLGLQSPFWLMLLVVILFQSLLAKTRFFRQFYYIGGNVRAAYLSGINVQRMQMIAFMIAGFLAGLSGMAFASRLATGVSIAGDGAELRVITAVILGGASLTGGKGTIWGALIGVVFIALINNIMIIAQISSYWQSIIIGMVLVLAVALDSLVNRQ